MKELLKGENRELVDLPLESNQSDTSLAHSIYKLTHILKWSKWINTQELDSGWRSIPLKANEIHALYNAALLFLNLTDLIECQIHSYLDQNTHFTLDAKWRPL